MDMKMRELVEKCLQASSIDQSSLSIALSNLAQCLSEQQKKEKEKQQKKKKKKKKEVEEEDNDAMEFAASSLLKIEIVRTGSTLTETQLHIQQQIDDCLDLCGPCVSLFAALAYIHSASVSVSASTSTSTSTSVLVSQREAVRSKMGVVDDYCSSSCIISSCRVIRRLLLGYKTKVKKEDGDDEHSKAGEALQTLLKDYIYSHREENMTMAYSACSDTTTTTITTANCERTKLEKQMLGFINSVIVVLPTQISNAFHSYQLKLPMWATRSKFHVQIIESSANAAAAAVAAANTATATDPATVIDSRHLYDLFEESGGVEMLYFAKIIEVLLRNGSANDVSTGIYQFWHTSEKSTVSPSSLGYNKNEDKNDTNTNNINLNAYDLKMNIIKYVIRLGTASLSSPRSCANLIRSSINKIISEIDIYPTRISMSNAREICREQCMPFLRVVSLSILSSSSSSESTTSNCDAFVNLLVLSPSPNGDSIEQKLIICCVIELLSASTSTMERSDGDTVPNNGKSIDGRYLILKYLIDVTNVWNDNIFINETDHFQQRHVTMFIIAAMDFMQKDNDDTDQQIVIQGLVLGVTNRLKVSEEAIRFDGMMVAEKLAPILGEELEFDELDGFREEDLIVEKKAIEPISSGIINKKRQVKREDKKKKKRSPIEIDPDEEYASESEESKSSGNDSDDSSEDCSSSDSSWGEENAVAFDLSDNEDDLRPVPKPKYLIECLELLRYAEEDNEAKYMHEVALEEVSSLVRAMPPDLHDMATLLTRELLHIENKYNLTSFAQLRWEGLCALAVCAPLAAIPCLQEDIFADVAFEVRLDSLEVMKYSSSELCGQVELDKSRKNNRAVDFQNVNIEKAAESIKTRRWGRGRRVYETVSNKFGELAPLFFYPLIQGFTESKHNDKLWGGENGGRLLSCLLTSLSTFVESSGNHPGTSVIASDLLDLSWSFYEAQNPEVRLAVLISVATCLPHCNPDSLARMLCTQRLPYHLQSIAVSDPHKDCRQLASLILASLSNITNMAISSPIL